MPQNYELTAELFRVYMNDESEKANTGAVATIERMFDAAAGALFFINLRGKRAFYATGMQLPIEITEEQWCAGARNHAERDSKKTFINWSPSGKDMSTLSWISAPLLASGKETGWLFLGKKETQWQDGESQDIEKVTQTLAEIALIRARKQKDSCSRCEAENELEKNQRRMVDFFESFHDMIYTTDGNDRFTSINSAGVAMFGLESRQEIIGKPFSSFALNVEVHEYFLQKIQKDGFIDDHEIILKRSDGKPFYCLETSFAVKASDGSIVEIQGLIKDITDRIENERELWKMNLEFADVNNKLQQAQALMVQQEKLASIGQLAAGIAHEINNPLGFLMSNQNMLREYFNAIHSAYVEAASLDDPRFKKLSKEKDLQYMFDEAPHVFDESEDGFTRIMRIVSNLKTFARMDQSVEMELFDVNLGIESTLGVAWNEIKYVAEVTKKFGDLPKIYARAGEINQVVLNILVNAAQAIGDQKRPGLGHIEIETRSEGSSIVILISDDGPGIPENIRLRIFDPFFTTKEPGKGTGLGLSISYDLIVIKHRGKITVESDPGKGTVFRVELPVDLKLV